MDLSLSSPPLPRLYSVPEEREGVSVDALTATGGDPEVRGKAGRVPGAELAVGEDAEMVAEYGDGPT